MSSNYSYRIKTNLFCLSQPCHLSLQQPWQAVDWLGSFRWQGYLVSWVVGILPSAFPQGFPLISLLVFLQVSLQVFPQAFLLLLYPELTVGYLLEIGINA